MENLPPRLAASNAPKIAQQLGKISTGKVLDVATGDGEFIDLLLNTLKGYGSITGVDISKKEVKKTRKRFKDKPVKILQMNAEALEFGDATFDMVCLSFSMHHITRLKQVLTEMKRVLKPGGYFILQEMYRGRNFTLGQKTSVIYHHWSMKIEGLKKIPAYNTFTRGRIIQIAESLKLKKLQVYDSTLSLNCLFCDERFLCDDPKNEKVMNQAFKSIDKTLKGLSKHPDRTMVESLKEEGELIKNQIQKYGYDQTPLLFIIGRK